MKITQADITAANISAITDFAKLTYWGQAPFPEGFVPILAVTSIGNPLCGILMRANVTGRFVIGSFGVLKNLDEKTAVELINKADVGNDTWQAGSWGGAREGAGRPKTVPKNAKRRSVYMTEEEFKFVKDLLETTRQENISASKLLEMYKQVWLNLAAVRKFWEYTMQIGMYDKMRRLATYQDVILTAKLEKNNPPESIGTRVRMINLAKSNGTYIPANYTEEDVEYAKREINYLLEKYDA